MQDLRQILTVLKGRIPLGWVTHNFRVKIVAFFMALFLWFYVVTENTYQYEMEVPVRITNLDPDRALLTPLPQKAVVRLEGSGKALIGLLIGGEVWIAADLAGVKRNKVWRLSPGDVVVGRAGGRIRVVEVVSPDTVRVELDIAQTRHVPVRPEIELLPAPGYTVVSGPLARPDSVTVRGPRAVVRKLREVTTARRRYEDVKGDFSVELPVEPVPLVSITPPRVHVVAKIEELMEKAFSQMPVEVEHVPDGLRGVAVPPSVFLVLQGGISRMAELDRRMVRVFVDYRRPVRGAAREYEVQVDAPPGVSVQRVEPTRVRVILEKVR